MTARSWSQAQPFGGTAFPSVVRYFEVAPGGATRRERHEHLHVVIVLRGQGEVLLGGERLPIAPHDAAYAAPNDEHQFVAAGDAPLGFLCVVDRRRGAENGT